MFLVPQATYVLNVFSASGDLCL